MSATQDSDQAAGFAVPEGATVWERSYLPAFLAQPYNEHDPLDSLQRAVFLAANLVSELKIVAILAGGGDVPHALPYGLVRFSYDSESVSATVPRDRYRAALDVVVGLRFQYNLGTVSTHCGAAASACHAVLDEVNDLNYLLAGYREVRELFAAHREAGCQRPRPGEVAGLRRDWSARSSRLAEALLQLPIPRLLDHLAGFYGTKKDNLLALARQEITQAGVMRPSPANEPRGLPTELQDTETPPDGPEPPHWLRWRNKRYRIGGQRSSKPWQLLQFMWGRAAVNYSELSGDETPWPDSVDWSTVATTVHRLNADLPPDFPRLRAVTYTVTWTAIPENFLK